MLFDQCLDKKLFYISKLHKYILFKLNKFFQILVFVIYNKSLRYFKSYSHKLISQRFFKSSEFETAIQSSET